MLNLTGKNALVTGIANNRSIAWGIAQQLHKAGANLGITYLPDERGKMEKKVAELVEPLNPSLFLPCNVQNDQQIQSMGVAKAGLEISVRYLAAELGPQNIRGNAISAGPIRTLASSAVGGILDMIHHVEEVAPLRRTVTQLEVGNAAAFLCSDLSSGITGQILYVDAGYEIMGM